MEYYMAPNPKLQPYIAEAKNNRAGKEYIHKFGVPFMYKRKISPGQLVPVVARSPYGAVKGYPFVWGWGQMRDTTRWDIAATNPLLEEAWQRRRCVIPASWYYEYKHIGRPDGGYHQTDRYVIQTAGKSITWLAGLYNIVEKEGVHIPAFTILRTDASEDVAELWKEMPVVLSTADANLWTAPDANPEMLVRGCEVHFAVEKDDQEDEPLRPEEYWE